MPGSGKSTIAGALAAELGVPLLAKDTMKEALMDTIGAPDVVASRRLGLAAIRTMLVVAADARAAVLDSVWDPAHARSELARLPGPVVEVSCQCSPDLARARYAARSASRHSGHFDGQRADPADLIWQPGATTPIAGPWPVLTVDTTTPVAIALLTSKIRAEIRRTGG